MSTSRGDSRPTERLPLVIPVCDDCESERNTWYIQLRVLFIVMVIAVTTVTLVGMLLIHDLN